jgi:hypothetical protein
MHLHGEALDLAWPRTFERTGFLRLAEEIVGDGGLGIYNWGIHIDTGNGCKPRRRWGAIS